jgi:hypothetical protein
VGHDVRAARIMVGRVSHAGKPLQAGLVAPRARTEERFSDRQVPRADLGIGQPRDTGDGGKTPPIP